MNRCWQSRLLALLLAFLVPSQLAAQELTVPEGLYIYGELEETVSSKKKGFAVGDTVRAHAWRNVDVDGRVIIKAGAPILVRVSTLKSAKFAGIKGKLTLEAISVEAVDGSEILLDGGYDRSGRGRKGMAIGLALLAWPFVFIKGKQAVLESGTVFDATVQSEVVVSANDASLYPAASVAMRAGTRLEIEVLYDAIDPDEKLRMLPMSVRLCGEDLSLTHVVTVNEEEIEPIGVELGAAELQGDCTLAGAEVDLRELSKHFGKGINRFEIEMVGLRTEVILDVEM